VKRIHIIGKKNHGKTTLVVELVQFFTEQGLRVGTIKHTHHRHELDTPGKDSYRHRTAGADRVGIVSQTLNAVYWKPELGELQQNDDKYASFAPIMQPCDIVLVEGDTHTSAPKVEVWRAEVGTSPLAEADPSIIAVVTDDPLALDRPILRRDDLVTLGRFLFEQVTDDAS
jgi:molybdopterin-guanine dinucleotide biosynthesis protein MobB